MKSLSPRLIAQNPDVARLIKPRYTTRDVQIISTFLRKRGTFNFAPLENGLFSAALIARTSPSQSYADVWVRDNIHVAFGHYAVGKHSVAAKNVSTLMAFFRKYRHRFDGIIVRRTDPQDPMNRPHIRFDGKKMKEINQPWPHAQNDALGGFLWFYCKLAREGVLPVAPSDWRMLARFADYFRAIRYWQDEDSGHWEETRKIEASSIGMVVAGFEQLRLLIRASGDSVSFRRGGHRFNMEVIDESIKQGTVALKAILPFECIQPDPLKNRRYDAALLFLIHPLELISGSLADRVLRNVITQLGGDYGIRRYRGDSYWAPDYDQKLPPDEQIGDFSEDISGRNLLLTGKGSEAQWCIFDPVISCIYGLKFARTGRNEFLDLQTFHLNRSLAQLTRGDRSRDIRPFRCPELYYLKNGEYVPNDHLPLLWTQANLLMALKMLRNNLREHASRQGSIQKI